LRLAADCRGGRAGADTSPLPAVDYTVSRSWPLGGAGGWDYIALDASGARLFISRGDRVDVIETVSGNWREHREYPGRSRHCIRAGAAAGFTSNGRSNTVSVFELDTLRLIQEVPVSGIKPDAILYSRSTTTSSRQWRIGEPLGARREARCRSWPPWRSRAAGIHGCRSSGTIFVNIENDAGKTRRRRRENAGCARHLALAGCANPRPRTGAGTIRLFSVCANQVMAVTDSVTGKQVARS